MPTVTADMLARLMAADFDLLRARSRAVADLLSAADEAHVTCPRGTDLRLDLSGREAHRRRRRPHRAGRVRQPAVRRGLHRAVRRRGDGRHALAGLDRPRQGPPGAPDRRGRAPRRRPTGPEGERLYELLTGAGELGTNLAELGVGTNERARLTGNILEDEKILGTVHVAFGASAGIGGTVSVPIHLDVVVTDATLTIGDTAVLDAGRYVL